MAKKNTPPEEEIIDLTELIEEGKPASKAGAAAYARAAANASAPDDNDFEAALAQATSGDRLSTSESGRPVNPDEQLDLSDLNDIDNILESLQIPPQPQRKIQPEKAPETLPASGHSGMDEDIDSMLDMLGDEDAGKTTQEKSSVNETPDLDSELDDILNSFDDSAKPQSAKSSSSGSARDESDLTALVDSFAESEPEPAEEQTSAKKSMPDIDMEADLDAILGSDPQDKIAGDAGAVTEKTPPAPAASAEDLDLPDNLNDLLDDESSGEAASGKAEDGEDNKTLAHFPSQTEAGLIPQSTATVVEPALTQDAIANVCQGLLANHMGSFQDSLQKLSLEMGSQTAHLEDLSRTVTDISKRLFATESKLAAARTKIASLEKTIAQMGNLDDLFKDGTLLNKGFLNLIATSVGNAVQGVMTTIQASGVQPVQVQALAHAQEDVDGRLIQLETRLDQMEPALTARMDVVEKTAERFSERLHSSSESVKPAQLEELSNRLDSLELESNLAETVESLQKQLDDLAPQMIERLDLIEAQNSANKAASEARLERSASSDDLAVLSGQLNTFEEDVKARLETLESAMQSSALESDPDKLDARLDEFQKRVDALKQEFETGLEKQGTQNSAKFAELASAIQENSLASSSTDISTRLDNFYSEMNERISGLEGALQTKLLEEVKTKFDVKFADLQKSLEVQKSDFEHKLGQVDAQNSAKLLEIESALKKNGTESDITDLSNRIETLHKGIDKRISGLEKALNENESDKGNIEIEGKLAALQERFDAFVPDFETQLQRLETENAAKLAEIESKMSETEANSDLEANISELSSRLEELHKGIEERLETLEKLSRETNTVNVDVVDEKLEQLQAKFDQFEPVLSAKLEMASNQIQELSVRLDSLAMQGSETASEDLAARISAAEENDQTMDKKLAKLSSAEQSVNARVDSLEIRLDKLEPNFNIQIEKAAAATVARILNEEIKRLAGNQ